MFLGTSHLSSSDGTTDITSHEQGKCWKDPFILLRILLSSQLNSLVEQDEIKKNSNHTFSTPCAILPAFAERLVTAVASLGEF